MGYGPQFKASFLQDRLIVKVLECYTPKEKKKGYFARKTFSLVVAVISGI
jgi:hypothetical protein